MCASNAVCAEQTSGKHAIMNERRHTDANFCQATALDFVDKSLEESGYGARLDDSVRCFSL